MRKEKITYIVSNVDKAISFEWIVDNLQDEFELEFILLNPNQQTPLVASLEKRKVKIVQYNINGKLSLIGIFFRLLLHLLKSKPTVVHTHLFEATIVGLTVAKLIGIPQRVYTRHHSTYHHDYFDKAVKYDYWNNFMATHIVAISNNVRDVLIEKEGVSPSKVVSINHGFKIDSFMNVEQQDIDKLREKYNIPDNTFIIGSIARYIHWKGIEYIIEGFKEFYQQYPDSHLILANAKGPYKKEIKEKLNDLPRGSYTEIEFENNLFSLYKLLDAYVHTPIDKDIEAFGQTYVEALAAGIPSVFTLSGIAKDFIVNEKNALVVDFKSSLEITSSLLRLKEDKMLVESLKLNGFESVKDYDLKYMIEGLMKLYKLPGSQRES